MEKVKQLEKLIKEAVKPLNGYPVALSGGIDSDLLAALIRPKVVVSVDLPYGEKYDESKYRNMIVNHLRLFQHIIYTEGISFDKTLKKAVKVIGKPTPHFSLIPLYVMYEGLNELGEKDIVIGDGPDESMCGYTRDLIFNYLNGIYDYYAFHNYLPLIMKVMKNMGEMLSEMYGISQSKLVNFIKKGIPFGDEFTLINEINIKLKRPEIAFMSDKFAKHFGIKIHRPYMNKKVDEFMLSLPSELKVYRAEYGKYALRLIAEKYLPKKIAWRKDKMGGPVFPVNKIKGWMDKGEFDKTRYLEEQVKILKEGK